MPDVNIKRAYEDPARSDGKRILVDRIWPRGVSKEDAGIDVWLKEVAPSTELRKWFGHDARRWKEFRRRYREELQNNPAFDELIAATRQGKATLVYGARDEQHNQAVVLQERLKELDD